MILRNIAFENFGVFEGVHGFDLTPAKGKQGVRPITLIGGMNGAGKTTWLEGLLFCLYGGGVLRLTDRKVDYPTYLRSRIHKSPESVLPIESAAVTLAFDHMHAGRVDTYRVRREIARAGERAKEKLFVHRNGELVDEVNSNYWQEFLRDLVPPGLCSLFFFDGEKIQRLVDDDQWEREARSAIESLLGLDILDRLGADLTIYEATHIKHAGTERVRQELLALQESKSQTEHALLTLRENFRAAEGAIQELDRHIEDQNQAVMNQGGAYATERVSLEGEQRRLLKETDRLQDEIRSLCASVLPAMFARELCDCLRSRLASEAELTAWQAAEGILNRALDEVAQSPRDSETADVFKRVRERLQRPEALKEITPIHNLSYLDSMRTVSWLDEAQGAAEKHARRLYSDLEKTHRSLQHVVQQLNRVPSAEILQPLMKQLTQLHEDRGRQSREAERIAAEIHDTEFRLESSGKRQSELCEVLEQSTASQERFRTVGGIRRALASYRTKLLADRLRRLASEVCELFNHLSRKRGLLRSIQIDPGSFNFTLYKSSSEVIRRDQLSAGERQIFAIALLWGLARVSGRALPIIVDTPLGRLDSEHRNNLITKYFPCASHQVVLLSTDTEVDRPFFKSLAPSIAHAYRLKFDETNGGTKVESGYFWREESASHVH